MFSLVLTQIEGKLNIYINYLILQSFFIINKLKIH